MKRYFGTTVPTSIPESSSWWAHQAKDLFALTEQSEMGMMEMMITIAFNDFAPEMLASARRGPFAAPDETELVEYLMTRLRTERTRLDHQNFALEHVLSYQRRVAATKDTFMRRGKLTPLGIPSDYWDRTVFNNLFNLYLIVAYCSNRTEAQMRAALHAHILCWYKRRDKPTDFKAIPVIERTAPGVEPRQRPLAQRVEPLREHQ